MKYVISENQYKTLLREDRVDFLRNQYVIDPKVLDKATDGENEQEEFEDGDRPAGGMKQSKEKVEPIQDQHNGLDIAYIVTNKKGKSKVVLTDEIFNDIVEADPSRKKEFVQWIITVFLRYLKEGDVDQAIRFISEDLPEARESLEVFDKVRKKKTFKTGAINRPDAPQNVSDITQYRDISHLYSVIRPFMESNEEDGGLWGKLKKYIDIGHAKLAYRDNDVLVYQPDTQESSCDPLGPLANWCTRRTGSSYFDSYRQGSYLRPDGSKSEYYVILPKTLFGEEGHPDSDVYPLQFHWESGQLHDQSNTSIEGRSSLKLADVIKRFPGLIDFFKKDLGALATHEIKNGAGLMDSKYLKYLNKFGGDVKDVISDDVYKEGVASIRRLASEQQGALQNNKYLRWLMENTDGVVITDYLDRNMEVLDFSDMQLTELPDCSEFTNANRISANGCGLTSVPPVSHLPKESLEILTLNDNQITEAPGKDYGQLKGLFVLNIHDNPLRRINVNVLEQLSNENMARFVINDGDLTNLSPENLEQYKAWEKDLGGLGFLGGS